MKQIEVNSEAWLSLILEISENYSDGSLIFHEWLKKKFGLNQIELSDFEDTNDFLDALQTQQFAYMTLVDTLRWQLLEVEQMFIRNIRGSGYVVIQPSDQTEYAYNEFLKTVKQAIKEADLIMNNVRKVTSIQQSKDNDIRAKCSILKQMINSIRK